MTQQVPVSIAELCDAIRQRSRAGGRIVVALAGPPGSGKSTLADRLAAVLGEGEPRSAAVLSMDGYHYDDRVLVARGLRARKGAPETFDVAGFRHMLARLKANEETEIAVPVFDRSIEIARAAAAVIDRSVRYLIAEGNYLLLDEAPWRGLRALYDLTVMIEEGETVLRQRLEERWRDMPASERAAKIDGNDLPNARRVASASSTPDFVISSM